MQNSLPYEIFKVIILPEIRHNYSEKLVIIKSVFRCCHSAYSRTHLCYICVPRKAKQLGIARAQTVFKSILHFQLICAGAKFSRSRSSSLFQHYEKARTIGPSLPRRTCELAVLFHVCTRGRVCCFEEFPLARVKASHNSCKHLCDSQILLSKFISLN